MAGRIQECFGEELETRWHRRRSEETAAEKLMDPKVRQSCYEEVGAVLPLFECEWFWRLWCVQELALAQQPLIYWGSVVLTWDSVLTVAAFVEAKAQLDVAHTGYAGVPQCDHARVSPRAGAGQRYKSHAILAAVEPDEAARRH